MGVPKTIPTGGLPILRVLTGEEALEARRLANGLAWELATPEESRVIRQMIQTHTEAVSPIVGFPTVTTVQKVISEKSFFQKIQSLQPKSLIGKITLGVTILASLYAIRLAAPFVVDKAQSLRDRVNDYFGFGD